MDARQGAFGHDKTFLQLAQLAKNLRRFIVQAIAGGGSSWIM
jgi:hypothetical protein